MLCQLSYSHRHCDYNNCDSELSEFRLALRKTGKGCRSPDVRLAHTFAEQELAKRRRA